MNASQVPLDVFLEYFHIYSLNIHGDDDDGIHDDHTDDDRVVVAYWVHPDTIDCRFLFPAPVLPLVVLS